MTGDEVAHIITALGFLITSLTGVAAFVQGKRNGKNIEVIEKATNSMKDALVKASKEASLAEGTAVGLEQGRQEQKDADASRRNQ